MAYYRKSRESGTLQDSFSATKKAYEEGQGLVFEKFVQAIYMPHIRKRKRSWFVDERIAHQHLFPTFGRRHITRIHRAEVETWLQNLCRQGLAASTCNRILAVLKSIFSLAIVCGKLRGNESPCLGIRPLKTLTCHIHLERRMLVVPLSKSGKPRYIPLSDEAARIIRAIPRRDDSPWLFPGRKWGRPLSDVYTFWNRIRRKLGLFRVRIHDLRHTFASFLVNAGHSLYEVQKLLGHSDPRTTMRYAHMEQTSLIAATQTISACLAQRENRAQMAGRRRFSFVRNLCLRRGTVDKREERIFPARKGMLVKHMKRPIFRKITVTIDRRTVDFLRPASPGEVFPQSDDLACRGPAHITMQNGKGKFLDNV